MNVSLLLAPLIDKFKASNPKIYALVVVILVLVITGAESGTMYGLFEMTETVGQVIKWAGLALLALTGSRTTRYVKKSSSAPPTNLR